MTAHAPRPCLRVVSALAFAGALLAAFAGPAAAQTVTRSHPLPIVLDEHVAPGALWIRFSETVFEQDFDTWSKQGRDTAAQTFVALVEALADKDVERARAMLLPRHGAPLAGLVDVMHEAFNGFRGLTVINRVRVGERDVFYVRFTGVDRRPVTQGIWLEQRDGGYKGWVVELGDPAEMLIRQALDATAEAPSRFAPVASSGAAYSLPADSTGAIRLELGGTPADFDVFAGKDPPFSPASALFQQAMLELLRNDWLAFQTHFTPVSAQKIGAWVNDQPAQTLEVAQSLPALTLRVIFEIPVADGGAWMFYSQGLGPDHSDDVVRVSRAAGNGRGALKLTSYRRRDLVLKAIFALPGFPDRRGPLIDWLAKHRVGGTR